MSTGYPPFDDARSKKVIFVAHCFLNQNARCHGSAETPAAMPEIPELLLRRDISIAQMPCPELGCLGLGREGLIFDQLGTHENQRYLHGLAQDLVYQIKQYQQHCFRVLGVLGINCSPSCGVDCYAYNGAKPGQGAFIRALVEAFEREGVDLPIIGVADEKYEEALEPITKLDE